MRHKWVPIAALLLTGLVEASCGLSSVRLSSGLVKTGDAERRVLQAAPDRSVALQTAEGGAAGFRHDFYQPRTTIQIHVLDGRVVRICRV